MFEVIPEWAQNQAAQHEQQNPSMPPPPQGIGASGGNNLASILGGPAPQGGMMGAMGGAQSGYTPVQLQHPSSTNALLGGLGFNAITGGLFRHNNSALQDIQQAINLGRPITDAQWAQAGLPPGGGAQGAGMMAAGGGQQVSGGGVYPVSGNANQLSIPKFSTQVTPPSGNGGTYGGSSGQDIGTMLSLATLAARFM